MKSINELSKKEKVFVWTLLGIISIMLMVFAVSYLNPDNHVTYVTCNGKNYTFTGFDVQTQIDRVCTGKQFNIVLPSQVEGIELG